MRLIHLVFSGDGLVASGSSGRTRLSLFGLLGLVAGNGGKGTEIGTGAATTKRLATEGTCFGKTVCWGAQICYTIVEGGQGLESGAAAGVGPPSCSGLSLLKLHFSRHLSVVTC